MWYQRNNIIIKNIRSAIKDNPDIICHGKSQGKPLPSQVLALVKVLNVLGLYSEKWAEVC